MKLDNLLKHLRAIAPEPLAESWDKVGLQLGSPDQEIHKTLLCIDLTESVLDEAIRQGVDLVVAYHPPIFKPLTALTTNDTRQRIILRAAQAGLAIYSPHTALDAAEGGVNDWLAAGVGRGDIQPIRPTESQRSFKLVTFVPPDYANRLRAALSEAGAGHIGHYSECSFSTPGEGTFKGDETTHPAVGEAGRFERVAELHMEMLTPATHLADILAALRQTHPYEEPAYDLYPLHVAESSARTGQGRLIDLEQPTSLPTLVQRLKHHLGVKHLDIAAAPGNQRLRRVGLCAGAGGSLLPEAGPIDLFFTGEMRHHDVLAAVARGISVVLAGHTQTERPYLKIYRQRLQAGEAREVQWLISRADRAPSTIR